MSAYCVFRVGERRAALDVSVVRETIDPPEVSPVPLAPRFVKGFFNLRGEITALIDLVPFVGGNAATPGHDVQAIVVEQGALRFATTGWEISMWEGDRQNFVGHPQAPIYPALEAEVSTDRGAFHALSFDRLAAALSRALQFNQLLKAT